MICHVCGKSFQSCCGISQHLRKSHEIKLTDDIRTLYNLPSVIERRKAYIKTHKEEIQEYNKRYLIENCEELYYKRKNWYEINKGKIKEYRLSEKGKEVIKRQNLDPREWLRKEAHNKVNYAILSGKIKRGNCEICGAENAQAHHCDYNKPLEVMWLCSKHHGEWHVKNEPVYPI